MNNDKQLTVRGLVIGAIGAVILTCSSMFIALKTSALPWPIIFVVLVSMFILKLFKKTNHQEINVTQTAMSSGAMVAGGLAFTIPGIWMLNPDANVSLTHLLGVTLGGVLLGLLFTALFRKYFIETKALPFAMGEAAAVTLKVGENDKKKAGLLFGSMGVAGLFTYLRDAVAVIPPVTLSKSMMPYGSFFGLWYSPMLASIGYIIGPVVIGVWFLGALIGDFGILFGCTKAGLWDVETAKIVKSSLGIGLMVGTGLGILIKGILPQAKSIFGSMFSRRQFGDTFLNMRGMPIALIAAFTMLFFSNISPIACIIVIIGTWLATSMSSQCVGQSGINPMEIFGIIILLAVKACCRGVDGTEAFFVAAVVAVACGLTGDVMNDFKTGHILKTDPKSQWIAEAVGAIIGAITSVVILAVILKAYGANAFGPEKMFPAAQASAVASMVGGIGNVPAFVIGLVLGTVLYCINFPVITLGLGVYLPFYLSATAAVGGLVRFIVNRFAPNFEKDSQGTIIASGLLGGESIVGVIIAIITAIKICAA